jgi:hypothetical protein
MKAIKITAILLLSLSLPICSQAQFGWFGKNYKVRKNPGSETYKLQDEDELLQDGSPDSKEAWIVYSDQSNNITYKSPGGDVQLKTLSFMQPCYVIGTKGDYLELAGYDPSQKINGRKISKKSTDNLGWIHKDKLLLWSNAIKDKRSKFNIKAITTYGGEKAFTSLPGHVSNDSFLLFESPFMKEISGKCSMESICYIYKQSSSGNEYLVGAAPQLFADSARVAKAGWISKDLVKIWGTRALFTFDAHGINKDHSLTAIPFYSDSSFLQPENKSTPMLMANDEYSFGGSLLQQVYPLNGFYKAGNEDGLIKTAVMTDVLDRSHNEIYNVSGNKITYNEFKNIVKNNGHLNIVFVVDGGSDNAKYMTQLYSILQNLELQVQEQSLFKKVKIGAVVYKDNLRGCKNSVVPLTASFSEISDFWNRQQKESFNCNDTYSEQAVFSGLADASELLYKSKEESNIVILFGAAGNSSKAGSSWSDVISKLSYVNARMLIFQSHSLSDPSFNNFVVQAKDLVLQSAENIADLKKEKMVDYSGSVLTSAGFSLGGGDSGVYYLNYPNKAMTQGYVLFPAKGEVMQPSLLSSSLDSLIAQIGKDNRMIEESLFRYFLTIGAKNTKVESKFAFRYPNYTEKYVPSDFLKSNSFRTQSFYIPAWTSINTKDSSQKIATGLLLNREEYLQITSRLLLLSGSNKNYKGESRTAIYNQVKSAVNKAVKEKGMQLAKPVSDLTFSEAMEVMTGYRSLDPVWLNTSLSTFKGSEAVSIQEGIRFLEESNKKAFWMQDNINNNKIQFSNNGRTYYLLTSNQLPGKI